MNLNHSNTYTFLFLIWFSVGSLSAQNNQLRAYTLENGLPQSQVYDIIQDEIGYLWLGTQGGGLCNFDGEKFTVWNESDGLLSNYIHSLFYTNDSLFIGTKRGLSIKTKTTFTNIESPQINKIYRVENKLFLATNNGIYQYANKATLTKMQIHTGIDTSVINDIGFDGEMYWLATNNGLWKLDRLNKSVLQIEKYAPNNFTSIAHYKGTIFASTFNDGILVINTKANTQDVLIREPLRINNITIQNDNELWVATDNDGITVIDPNNYTELKKINRKNGLKVSHIRKSISDRQSNIWIATSGGGLYKYFQNNFKHYDQETGLKGNRVYAIHSAKNGIWVSNSEAGLVQIDSLGIHHIPQEDHFSEVKIKTIASDSKRNIWAGTDGRGILFRETIDVFDIKIDSVQIDSTDLYTKSIDTIIRTETKNHIISASKGLLSDWIRQLYVDNQTIWAATYSSGITKFNYYSENDSLVVLKNFGKRNGIEDLHIRDMKRDSLGRIWYATESGHIGYINTNKVTHLGSVLNQKVPINTLLFHENKIYIGTAGRGIWWSDMTEPISFKKLDGQKHPYSNNIYQLIFDSQNYLWVGTERGVDKIVLDQSNEIVDVFHFGRNDGFLGIETCLNAVTKDEKNNLWFGAIYGLTKYQPSETTKATIQPKLHFQDIEIAYKSVDSINLIEWTNSDKILQLSPEQTQLTFSYRSIDIDHPNEIQYRFKLNSIDWSPWATENKQNLAGLAYGTHSFSAQARNYRWEESDPISFQFFIDSPLYKKAWFQWAILGLVVFILIIITLLFIKRITKKNKQERERLQMKNHLLSLEHKALQLQMNPHFIFNVLNGIKAMGTSNPQKMNTTINTFATLLRETLYNSRKEEITLDQEIKTLKNYIEVEKLMTEKSFTYTISVNSDLDPEEILIPPMLIQPFVENAIRHGILKGNKEGELKIEFNSTEQFLHCKVLDNGIGIFQSQKAKTKTDHQSMALKVTKERLESISGKDALKITEVKGDENTVSGTQITFKIPLLTDY